MLLFFLLRLSLVFYYFVKQMMILLFLVFNLIIRQTSKYVSFIQIWFYRD